MRTRRHRRHRCRSPSPTDAGTRSHMCLRLAPTIEIPLVRLIFSKLFRRLLRADVAPPGDAPLNPLVSDQGGIQAGFAENPRRRFALPILAHADALERFRIPYSACTDRDYCRKGSQISQLFRSECAVRQVQPLSSMAKLSQNQQAMWRCSRHRRLLLFTLVTVFISGSVPAGPPRQPATAPERHRGSIVPDEA